MNDVSSSLRERYQRILTTVQKTERSAVLIAVSKYQTVDQIEALYHLGHRDFGENYAQELAEKAVQLKSRGCTEIRWHFIGHLQRNKVKQVIPYVSAIHSVDSVSLAKEIGKRWTAVHPRTKLPVFLQVNIDQEKTKSGFMPDQLFPNHPANVGTAMKQVEGIEIEGLMCIPESSGASPEKTRNAFVRLRELELKCRPLTLGKLSMGMSDDFETALQEGATHIRVGTALFGARKQTL